MMGKKLTYLSSIGFLSKYIARHKSNFLMFYVGWFFDMLLGAIMPVLFGVMIDEVVYYNNLDAFLRLALVFVAMSVFSCLLYFLIYAQHQYLMGMYVFDIQRDVFRHLQKCDPEYLSDAKSGDIISVIQHYARECMHFVIRNVIHTINGVIGFVILTAFVFIISPYIGLLTLAAIPLSVTVSLVFKKKIRRYSDAQREYYGGYISYMYEVFTAMRDIRLLGAEKKVTSDFVRRHREMYAVNVKSGVSSLTAENIISGVNLAVQLAIFTLCAWMASRGEMTIGTLTIVITYFGMLASNVAGTINYYLSAQDRVSYIQRIYDFLNTPIERGGSVELRVTEGNISFGDVGFAYKNGGNVVSGFSLDIRPGERLALCGKSGCGKTTLAYMLIGFYKPHSGYIEIDGQRLDDCSLRSIRRQIGLVSQDVLLFDGSIRDNMLLGKPGASEEEIRAALENAGIWDFVSGLPEGIDTVIGSCGINLSGGQKQRLAIARIYLKNPKIIIFDEATSALDAEVERQIHDAWKTLLAGRTSIIIAHRQSSVMLCGRAAVMENGRITDIGEPENMAYNSVVFRELFALKGEGGDE